jgi:hypothetical protein
MRAPPPLFKQGRMRSSSIDGAAAAGVNALARAGHGSFPDFLECGLNGRKQWVVSDAGAY